MSDNLLGPFEDLIKYSMDLQKNNTSYGENWRICVILESEGWKNEDVTQEDGDTDIVVVWAKGDKKHGVRLGLRDQYKWLKYIESKENKR